LIESEVLSTTARSEEQQPRCIFMCLILPEE